MPSGSIEKVIYFQWFVKEFSCKYCGTKTKKLQKLTTKYIVCTLIVQGGHKYTMERCSKSIEKQVSKYNTSRTEMEIDLLKPVQNVSWCHNFFVPLPHLCD